MRVRRWGLGLEPSGTLELAPGHSYARHLFDRGEELGDVDHGDKEESVADGVWNEPKILPFHADGVKRGGDIEHRQEGPPVEHARRRPGGESRDCKEQIAKDVH